MLTEGLLIAVATGLAAVLVELVRNRRRQDKVVHEVTPNSGTSMKDIVMRVEAAITELRGEVNDLHQAQARIGERIAALEAVAPVRRGMWR